MNGSHARLRSLFALTALPLATQAQTSFYGGDVDMLTAVSAERNALISDARVYDDFNLGERTNVQSIFGNFLIQTSSFDLITGLFYEIRKGISVGNEGTLLYSGILTPTIESNGMITGLPIYKVSGSLTDVTLDAGDYYLGLAVVAGGNTRSHLYATSGQNRIGEEPGDNDAFFDSVYYDMSYASTGKEWRVRNFSFGVEGVQATPEPASIAALGIGVAGLIRRQRAQKA